ncbi:Acrosome formation-associated factor [Heterocephalus glaber]|uniref:Acrosome formation-associated factor n=1 Tax=Heterocephalus glaber TaxID=10181 RepID=G5BPX0_HETGA|nr:Acrosome formation-associated factor [Heterocephalus glaber]
MNVIFFVFLSGVSSSGISNSEPSMEEVPDVISLDEDNQEEQDTANNPATHHEGEKNSNDIPANEKTGNYYKDIKQCSDVNATHEEEKQSYLEDLKLRLMLGITLMTFLIFMPLVIFCIATLYKLKQLSHKSCQSQYSTNPELAMLSYFHPSESISDTFSKSAESTTKWGTDPSDMRKPSTRMSKNITGSDDIGLLDESELFSNEEANEEINDVDNENSNEEINDVE